MSVEAEPYSPARVAVLWDHPDIETRVIGAILDVIGMGRTNAYGAERLTPEGADRVLAYLHARFRVATTTGAEEKTE